MKSKNKVLCLIIIILLITGLPFFSILFYQLGNNNQDQIQIISDKIMFDGTLLNLKNNRIIINFDRGTDLNQQKETILKICGSDTNLLVLDFISAIVCEVDETQISKISSMGAVKKIFLDEKIYIEKNSMKKSISYEDIFQLNECATFINSRAVPTTGQGINISIIDTGIDFTHSDLQGKMIDQVSFVTEAYGFDSDEVEDEKDLDGHGTHCAGIATGTGLSSPSNYNLTGIAPNAKLLNAKCLDRYGSGYLSGILAAIDWSINKKAAIISMSLGFDISDPDHPVCRAVDNATGEGIVVVASAGNSGPFFSTPGSPASARSIITVGATDKQDKITDFSSRGPTSLGYVDPDVVAPGENILSTAAKDSLLGKIMQLRDEYISGSDDNYMLLSGTSMSCPIVAGAVALLLEAFPQIDPYMVRIALMEGAESLGYTPNIEGAGRINLNNSYQFLQENYPSFNITTVIPKSIPIPPFELNMFPGDKYTDDIIIISGKKVNMSVKCIGNISNYVKLEPTSEYELTVNDSCVFIEDAGSQYTNLNLEFFFPLSINPGLYTGVIEVRDNKTGILLDCINLTYNIIIPRGRIYFDCFHNADSADHVTSNYYNFTKLMHANSIDVDFITSMINYPTLSQYDLLILPDIETPFTQRELNAIKKYWGSDLGGNILTLGNYYPSSALESLNEMLTALDVKINYTQTNIESSYDYGLGKDYEVFQITDINSHPITIDVTNFSWLTGVELEVNDEITSLANYSNKSVIAVYNSSNNHRIVCMGSERTFYDDFIFEENNNKLALQTIQWLLNTSLKSKNGDLRIEVIVNNSILELGNGNKTQIGFYVSDSSDNGIENLETHYNLSCTVSRYQTGVWNVIWTANSTDVFEQGDGAYYFNYSSNSTSFYKVNITVENLTISESGTGFSFFNTTKTMPKIVNYSLRTTSSEIQEDYDETITDVYRNADQIIINITLRDMDQVSDIQNVTAYITSLDAYKSEIKYIQMEMENTSSMNNIEANFSLLITPDSSFPAGQYKIFIEVVDSEGNSDYQSPIMEFYINDRYPDISSTQSKLNGISFSNAQAFATSLFHNQNFNIEITGTDQESDLSEMHAYVAIFSYFTIGLYAYIYELLWAAEIPFSVNSFYGTVSIPTNGVSEILDDSYYLSGSYILLAILLDSDGQYDEESYTYAQINIASFNMILMVIIIVIVVVAAIGIGLFIYYKRKKSVDEQKIKKVCENCGATVFQGQKYCQNCGSRVKEDEPKKA
ncbi:MAG: hypothetical protein EU551_00505 [Promethearchaeota archaeon]|nr:MAG: hypothetical protein EU551_00505 [Candidatus Lokiarchaeota archaeon]